ncbi:MAG: LemA family protein [Nitrospirae bacterium]|nr:LemA family protein [Nitrospirota bacterium]
MVWIPVVVLAALVLLVIVVIVIYNTLIRLKVQSENAWADIDVQLKRRHDLVPNLIETVKGYAGHEKQTFEAVITARNRAMTATTLPAKAEAEGLLAQSLKSLFALAEAYPQLRAVESFTQLQGSLNQIEEAVQNARRYYNAVVRDLNTKIQEVPSNFVANSFNFRPREFFEITEAAERAVPKVSFEPVAR